MGTNIYARINPPKAKREKLVKRLEEVIMRNDLRLLYDEIEELISTYKHDYAEVHLGKRSDGWKFLWQANYDWYDTTKESIDNFLCRDDIILYNEYGDILTPEQVWDEYASAEGNVGDGGDEFITEEGLRFCRYDFC